MLDELRQGIYFATPDEPFFQDLVQRDLAKAREVRLSLDPSRVDDLLFQSVLGHAQEGHKVFYDAKARFPMATQSDVIVAAGFNLETVKRRRQEAIDGVLEWIELAKQGNVDQLSVSGRPLLGVQMLDHYHVNPEYVFRGMILAGMMDNYEWRQKAVKAYQGVTIDGAELVIGGGSSYLVDKEKLLEWSPFGIEELANGEATPALFKELRQAGVLTTSKNPQAEVIYVRKKKGLGTSDDAAFIFAGELYKDAGEINARSAFLGAFVVDGVDTYDKCVQRPILGGYDESIGRQLRKDFSGLVPPHEIHALIYYAAKGNVGKVVSSSHKKLIQIQEAADPKQPTLWHHLRFMEERKAAQFRLGFEGQPSKQFYASLRGRLDHFEKERK